MLIITLYIVMSCITGIVAHLTNMDDGDYPTSTAIGAFWPLTSLFVIVYAVMKLVDYLKGNISNGLKRDGWKKTAQWINITDSHYNEMD